MSGAAAATAPEASRITMRGVLVVLCSTLGTATYAFTWNSVGVALPLHAGHLFGNH